MEYAKIKQDGTIENMPNPYRVTVSNPTETVKAKLAEMFGWLEKVETTPPEYDTETQYITYHWEEIDGKVVQIWEIHDKEPEPPTIEERVDSLEENVSDIINGVTE